MAICVQVIVLLLKKCLKSLIQLCLILQAEKAPLIVSMLVCFIFVEGSLISINAHVFHIKYSVSKKN